MPTDLDSRFTPEIDLEATQVSLDRAQMSRCRCWLGGPRIARGAARFVTAFVLAAGWATVALAETAPLWLRPANVSGDAKVRVNGRFALGAAGEYFKGRYVPLNNWNGDWGAFVGERAPKDGGVFLQLHAPDSPEQPSRLFLGVKIPRFPSLETGHDSGRLELYFGFRGDLCADPEDRKITLDFIHWNGGSSDFDNLDSPLFSSAWEEKGAGSGDCSGALPLAGATPHLVDWALGIEGGFEDGSFYFAEVEVVMPPSVYSFGELLLGIRYSDRDYQTAGAPRADRTMTLPNDPLCQRGEPCRLTWGSDASYQRIDLTEPKHPTLGVSVYNVGQMLKLGLNSVIGVDVEDVADLFTHDGGVGDAEDVAEAIWSRDVVCLAEIMSIEDRQEVVEEVNEIRGGKGLPPVFPVNADRDTSPNLLLLSSWPAMASEVKKFSELDPGAAGPDDDVAGSDRGAKGVIWARIMPPPKCRFGAPNAQGVCPEGDVKAFQPEWLDVFCTHTQAPCSPSSLLSDPLCEAEGDQHANAKRQAQFQALGEYMAKQRQLPGPDGRSGLTRPALLLGDLNQVGPRSLAANWGNDDNLGTPAEGWLAGFQPPANTDIKTTGQEAKIAQAYRDMRRKLWSWERTTFDALLGDDTIGGYDVSANTSGEGSWIGTNGLGQVGDATSYECTPSSHPNLKDNVRVDYVMLIPSTTKLPDFHFRWPPGGVGRAEVDRHFMERVGTTDNPSHPILASGGCVSDHAEVFAKLQLVPYSVQDTPNPFRENRLIYRVAQLDDVENADDTLGDDGSTDWYTNIFWLESFECPGTAVCTWNNPGNLIGRCDADWPTSITPAGKVSQPGWEYRSHELKGNATAKIWLEVGDADSVSNDYYDSHSRTGCKHTEIFFDLKSLAVQERGCGIENDLPPRTIDQGTAIAWFSKGNGEGDDVQILNIIALCSISQDPFCKTEKTGPGQP